MISVSSDGRIAARSCLSKADAIIGQINDFDFGSISFTLSGKESMLARCMLFSNFYCVSYNS